MFFLNDVAVDVAQCESNNIKRYASECNRITFNNQREFKKKKKKTTTTTTI